MRKVGMLIAVVPLLWIASHAISTEAPARTPGLFATLKVGQPVSVKDLGTAYEITSFDMEMPQGYTIMEIGDNYIVVQDIAHITDLRIPVFAIKAVVLTRTKLK